MTYAKFAAIRREVDAQIHERGDVTRCGLVAIVAQEHMIMAGPAGLAKSMHARAVFRRSAGGRYLEMDLSESTTPEDVFGPLDVPAYVNDGQYRQVLTGGLADVEFFMGDEFFNVNQVTGHKLMPALNERVYKVGGRLVKIPLMTMFSGTNKIIADDPEFMPIWDRIALRVVVDYIQDPDTRLAMSLESLARRAAGQDRTDTRTPGAQFTTLTLDEVRQAGQEALALEIPQRVMEGYRDLSQDLRSQGIVLSDRRVGTSWPLVMANAWLNGHDEVWLSDLDILVHSWWTTFDNKAKAFSLITEAVNPILADIMALQRDLSSFKAEFAALDGQDPLHQRNGLQNVMKNVAQATTKLTALGDDSRATKLAGEYEAFKDKCLNAYQTTLGF